jgi:GlpG protein
MRLIGHLPTERAARTFADYLYVHGIQNQIEDQPPDGWAVWVSEEDQLDRASAFLAAFRQSPDDPKYRAGAKDADKLRAEEERKQAEYRKKLQDRRHLFRPLAPYGVGPLTFGLIAISVTLFLLARFGGNPSWIRDLFISDPLFGDSSLPEVRHGQVWRLITPIFLHHDFLHILFNMWWLRDLGSMIEARQSSLYLLVMVVVIALCSNLAQTFMSGPHFLGMSGVVYGLLGYVWIRGKCDPGSGLFLHPSTVMMMIIWFVVCWSGALGPIANWAHTGGLVAGMAWGYLASLRYA